MLTQEDEKRGTEDPIDMHDVVRAVVIQPEDSQLPDGTYAINYYYPVVDLPAVDNIIMQSPIATVDQSTGEVTVTYNFSYEGHGPGMMTDTRCRMLPAFLDQEYGTVSYIKVVGPPPDPSHGIMNQFEKEGTVAQQTSHPMYKTTDPVGDIRTAVVESITEQKYWVIGLVKTQNSEKDMFLMKDTVNQSWVRGMTEPNPDAQEEYVASTGYIESLHGEYHKIYLNSPEVLYDVGDYNNPIIV